MAIPHFPLTLPLSPGFGGEGGVRGLVAGIFYATFGLRLHFYLHKLNALSSLISS